MREPVLVASLCVVLVIAGCSGTSRPSAFPAPGDTPTAVPTSSPAAIATGTPVPVVTPPPSGPPAQAFREGRFADAAVSYALEAQRATTATARSEALRGAGMARFEDGDREGAIASLKDALLVAPSGSAEARRAGYLLGLRLNEAGRAAEAASALKPLFDAPASDTLQPYFDVEYGRALAAAGDVAGANSAFERAIGSAHATDDVRAEALGAMAESARLRGDDVSEERALVHLNQVSAGASSLYELGVVAARLGDSSTFRSSMDRVITAFPGSRFALLAIGQLDGSGVAIDPGKEGLVYYRRGMYAEARAVLGPSMEDTTVPASERAFRAYYFAAATEDGGFPRESIPAYDRVEALDSSSRYVHSARYWAARVSEGLGDEAGASHRYVKLVIDGPGGEFTAEARFRAGYVLVAAGDPAGAVATWDRLGATRDPGVLYWRGRALETLGNRPGAEESFRAAVAADRRSFYALEAGRRLGQAPPDTVPYQRLTSPGAIDWSRLEAWLSARIGAAPPAPAPSPASELMAVGLRQRAGELLLTQASGATGWQLYFVLREAGTLGLADVGAQLAVRLRTSLGATYEEAPADLMRLAYPLDYATVLDREAQANGLDPLFLASLVRQESFWNPAAVSVAEAYGLTQVIPETGRAIADELGMHEFSTADLLRPAVSLRFGANYIGGQLRRFGSPYIALAAYNAGPGAASRWAARAAGGSPADFVEEIEYAETEAYVRLIVEAYAHYRDAYRE